MSSNRSVETERRSYVNWINIQLAKSDRDPRPEVSMQLEDDLANGVSLNILAEVLTGKKERFQPKPRSEFQYMQNNATALASFRNDACIIQGADNASVTQKNSVLVCGLIWQLMLRYTIASNNDGISVAELRAQTLAWVNARLESLPSETHQEIRKNAGQEVTDEPIICKGLDKASFHDSCVIAGLAVALQPDQSSQDAAVKEIGARIQQEKVSGKNDGLDNKDYVCATQAAMTYANDSYKIPLLISADDMVNHFNNNAAWAYISYYKQHHESGQPPEQFIPTEKLEEELQPLIEEKKEPEYPTLSIDFDEILYLLAENNDKSAYVAQEREETSEVSSQQNLDEIVSALQEKITQLNGVIKQYDDYISLNGQLPPEDEYNKQLYERIKAHNARLAYDIASYKAIIEEKTLLSNQIDELNAKNKACGEKHIEKEGILMQLSTEKDDLIEKLANLQEELAKMTLNLSVTQDELNIARKELEEQKDTCQLEHSTKIAELLNQIATLTSQLAEKDDKIAQLQEKNDDLQHQLGALTKASESAKAELDATNQYLIESKENINKLQRELDELQRENDHLTSVVNNTETADQLALLTVQLSAKDSEISKVRAENDELLKQFQQFEDNQTSFNEQLNQQKQQNKNLEGDINTLRALLATNEAELAETKQKLQHSTENGDNLQIRVDELERQVISDEKTINELLAQLKQFKDHNADLILKQEQLENEIMSLKKQNDELLQKLEEKLQEKNNEIAKLNALVSSSNSDSATQLANTLKQLTEARQQQQSAQKQSDAFKNEIARLKEQLAASQQSEKASKDAEKAVSASLAALKATQCMVNGACQCKCCDHKAKGGSSKDPDVKKLTDKLEEMDSKYKAIKDEYQQQKELDSKEKLELKKMIQEAQKENDRLRAAQEGGEDSEETQKRRQQCENSAKILLDTLAPQAGIVFSKTEPIDGGLHVIKVTVGKSAYNGNILPGEVIKSVNGEDMTKEKFAQTWKNDAKCGSTLFVQVQGTNPVDGKVYHRNVKMELGSRTASHEDVKALRRMADGIYKPGDEEILIRVQKQQDDANNGKQLEQDKVTDQRDIGQKGYLDENDMAKANGVYKRNVGLPGASRKMDAAFTSPIKRPAPSSVMAPKQATPTRTSIGTSPARTRSSAGPTAPPVTPQRSSLGTKATTPTRQTTATPRTNAVPMASPSSNMASPKSSFVASPRPKATTAPYVAPTSNLMAQRRKELSAYGSQVHGLDSDPKSAPTASNPRK